MSAVDQLKSDIQAFAFTKLRGFERRQVSGKKVIRDALLGTHIFEPYEIHLLDLPFVQRLRGIHQTALAYFTYPSANHTRFDHSLGVTIIVGKLLENIIQKTKSENIYFIPDKRIPEPSQDQIANTRAAALLHDIGHCAFSHVSEREYSKHESIKELKKSLKVVASGHEILSYLLVRSPALSSAIFDIGKLYGVNLDPEKISNYIIGKGQPEERYLANIVYGVFDADKLDYIPRDCYFTGLKMSVDLERIAYTMCLIKEGKQTSLGIDISGAYSVEQILFNKMLLYTSIYHHHKVLSSECMILGLFELLREHKGEDGVPKIETPFDFLQLNEGTLLNPDKKPPAIADYITKIKNRSLLQRAAVISWRTVEKSKEYFDFLSAVREDDKNVDSFRQDLLKRLHLREGTLENWKIQDIWLNVPSPPKFDEVTNSKVRMIRENGEFDTITLNEVFPTNNWGDAYAQHKLQSWVFCPPCDPALKRIVAEETQAILNGMGIQVKNNFMIEAKHR